jgi:periplasmic protein TonB
MGSSGNGSADDVASPEGADFTMSTAAVSPASNDAAAAPPAHPRVAVAAFVNSSAVVLPAVEPWVVKPPSKESGPAVHTASATPSAGSGTGAAKASGRKGSSNGQLGKRGNPVPPPKLLHAPPPRYPAAAKAARKSGMVAVLIQVRADGSAASARVYHGCGDSQLDQAAVEAARSWKFSATPSLGRGETVAVVVQATF